MGNYRGDANVARSYHQGIKSGRGVELWNSKMNKMKPDGG